VDRFHISTLVYQKQNHGTELDFTWLEERLFRLGFHLVFCMRRPETFREALKERLKVSGKPSQYKNTDQLILEQELTQKAVQGSRLPCLVLDVSEGSVPENADKIVSWLQDSGGLYCDSPAENDDPRILREHFRSGPKGEKLHMKTRDGQE